MLQAYLFRGRKVNLVNVINVPILVKKSMGITAEVKVSGAATSDPNLANNEKKWIAVKSGLFKYIKIRFYRKDRVL